MPKQEHEESLPTIRTDELAGVGGGYSPALFSAMQQAVGHGLTINSTVTGGHATHSYHYLGRAFDAIGPESKMQSYYNYAAHNIKTTELIHRNHFLKNGKPIHPIGGHDTHVHTAI
ncbi:MAG TPA: hypothetical protein VGG74_28075 [Kofleriaceae bacterium]|jgi:hypothetical protein